MQPIRLNDGREMPPVGLGTYKMPPDKAYKAVSTALRLGYRHIDTAKYYDNEQAMGRAVRDSGIPRDQVWVTTKLWPDDFRETRREFDASLKRLALDYVDLYLIHWPMAGWEKAWPVMEGIHSKGLAKSIGISNFTVRHMKRLLASCEVRPAVNQFELNPFMYQKEMVDFCRKEGIKVTAYAPLGRCNHFDNAHARKIADDHQRTTAQIFLRWSIQHGAAVIPKSVHEDRMKENFKLDFKLTRKEMDLLDGFGEVDRVAPDPNEMD